MIKTTLFQTNKSQAVRIPRDLAFPPTVREVTIIRDGARLVVAPSNMVWDDFFAEGGCDLADRNQPAMQDREPF